MLAASSYPFTLNRKLDSKSRCDCIIVVIGPQSKRDPHHSIHLKRKEKREEQKSKGLYLKYLKERAKSYASLFNCIALCKHYVMLL
ncbi:hypothetical protein BpHYR1_005062 [Brachionus plicatilis]|uniref:Uncharacterized protein n=1 Tax=Brachionus plicatilis TaxID=10195 RepID=A0A3M7T6B1_BRAPC|nr:hypothetical protein BpHYR1_005062 [Brachionus plicatilis]